MNETTKVTVKVYKECANTKCTNKILWHKHHNGWCDPCLFWSQQAVWDILGQNAVIIERQHYRLSSAESGFNFGGRMFKIRYFDGQVIETMLAHQGEIPLIFAHDEVFNDNAEFIHE